jgi:predicted alpha/beta hydrolase family esterase
MTPLRHVLVLHGWQGSGPDHWQTWLADRLARGGTDVRYPQLPQCDTPCPDRWGAALHAELDRLGTVGERVVVCHSLACVLWLREAGRIRAEHRADRVLLVAPPCPGPEVEPLAGFFPSGACPDAVRHAAARTTLVCSDDDPYCPREGAAEAWGAPLSLATVVLPGAGHLNPDSGFGPWPEVEAWVGGEDEAFARAASLDSRDALAGSPVSRAAGRTSH